MSAHDPNDSLRQALLDAAQEDLTQALEDAPQPALRSLQYQRWEADFLSRIPQPAQTKKTPQRPHLLPLVACFLLAVCLVSAGVLVASSEARARVVSWVPQRFQTHISYLFHGETAPISIEWRLTELPAGYAESDVIDLSNMVIRIYSNGDPDQEIELEYQRLAEGSGFSVDNEWHLASSVQVRGHEGQLFTATNDSPNMILWFDEDSGYGFLLTARLDGNSLLALAESVSFSG